MMRRHFTLLPRLLRAISSGLMLFVFSGACALVGSDLTHDGQAPVELRVQTSAGGNTKLRTPNAHWSVAPDVAEHEFERGELRILTERYAGGGVTGARRLGIELVAIDQNVTAKWKPMPRRLDGFNNSPRKEIAAYEIQKLFLDPENYVVPTSSVRCLRGEQFIDRRRHRSSTLPGSNCELGVLSLWLEDVTLPDPLLDEERFSRDPRYARHLADFNLLTHLVKHKDGRSGNFLVSTNDGDRRVFAIDNGVSFTGLLFNWFVPNWKKIRVPALRRDSVERLRQLSRADIEKLGVLAQLEWQGREGIRVVPGTPNLDPEEGVRARGRIIQLGLDEDEIENLWERIEHLIEDVDDGKVAVF